MKVESFVEHIGYHSGNLMWSYILRDSIGYFSRLTVKLIGRSPTC